MYPPNGWKGAQRLAKLFPANRRTSVRPRPRLPATIVRNKPSACTGLRPKALVAQSRDSGERGRTLAPLGRRANQLARPQQRPGRDPLKSTGATKMATCQGGRKRKQIVGVAVILAQTRPARATRVPAAYPASAHWAEPALERKTHSRDRVTPALAPCARYRRRLRAA